MSMYFVYLYFHIKVSVEIGCFYVIDVWELKGIAVTEIIVKNCILFILKM